MRNSESKQKRTNFPTGEDLGSGGIFRVMQKNRSKHTAQILACGGYRYIIDIPFIDIYSTKLSRIFHGIHLPSPNTVPDVEASGLAPEAQQ
jgi:hypothetical protein